MCVTTNKMSRLHCAVCSHYHFHLKLNCVCVRVCVCVCARMHSVAQSCLILSDPMDCSLPGSSVHGILQVRILEWVTISSSRESSWLRDQIRISCTSCFGRLILCYRATWETPNLSYLKWNKFSSSVALDTFQVLDGHTWLPYWTAQIENISIITESFLNSTYLDCFSEDTSC